MGEYRARQGDTIASIAKRYGLFRETIWNHSNNVELRQTRNNPNILYPGDIVFIPDKEHKEVSIETGKRHKLRRIGVPEILRIRLLNEHNEPRCNVPYSLEIEGNLLDGVTDSDGFIQQSIPPDAERGRLIISGTGEEYNLRLGHLDPITENSGIQARLKNLGIYTGEVNGQLDDETLEAINEFQRQEELDETGELDENTRQRLGNSYGS